MKIAFVVGENSSDRLGAALIRGLRNRSAEPVEVTGLGGDAMAAEGLTSLFDIDELSIVGVGAVLARLPQLVGRIGQTVRHILAEKPDALVVIDSYAFSHRVARRVRKALPDLAIVNYVPPAVWAYHPERSTAMAGYIDRAICVFPFEPAFHARHGGPPSTYVGHPLMHEPHLAAIMARLDSLPAQPSPGSPPTLLILPGSRRGEINRLLGDFGRTLELLDARLPGVRAILPAVPRLRALIEEKVADWPVKPEIVTGEAEKWAAFAAADAALAASGTVALELALAGVPMALCYRLDPVGYILRHLITGWTAALPNYITDHPLVPEHFHEFIRPEALARRLQRLLTDTPERRAQVEGFRDIRRKMAIDVDPGDAAAAIVLAEIRARSMVLPPQPSPYSS
ncbi:lipid-A-disaccharide synthase [Aureimonas sp. SA4125]|uniref:lipid-A-disaccharide synthase n=1 Tax=Aureimonas sp. SA4125 TaxID=2826993 RepID=UPI001CC65A01|nr:lipid-A-disaccharide synthase [Aureimonas sp. SA4125]BDA84702.1 lipid-A-disaccharide synthase [Aureimonas sp. SA4125]